MLQLLLSLVALLGASTSPASLSGKVLGPDGAEISGATVAVYNATPGKDWTPRISPDLSRLRDIARTGTFTIENVDPDMKYDLFVQADGYRPLALHNVDPANGQIIAKLEKLPENLDVALTVRGHVVDDKGNPVPGAHVEVQGGKHGRTRWADSLPDIEKETFTDSKGDFTLICKQPDIQPDLKLTAPNLAPMISKFVPSGDVVTPITMTPGASVGGRLVKDGKPVAHLPITLLPEGYRYEITAVESTTISGDDGTFVFPHVHPDFKYNLFAPMKTAGDSGAMTPQPCNVTGDGMAVELGDVTVETGFTISGTLISTEPSQSPAGASIRLSQNVTSDTQETRADAQGHFEFKNVPQGVYWMRIESTGLCLSRENESYYLGTYLKGLVDDNITLRVQLEPGPANGTSAVSGDRVSSLEKIRLNGVTP